MADVLSVIADVLKNDKQQKREQAKIMREVQKKLKEKDSEEVAEEPGDKEDYMKFFAGKLKKYGVKSPSELDVEKKKKFFNEIEKDWKHDSNEEVEDKDLGKRVKARMEAEDEVVVEPDDEEEDEDEAPVGDPDDPDTEPEEEEEENDDDDDDDDEPSEDQIDKIADLVVQKLKDKADEEEEEEQEPDPTEAEGGKEEEIDTKPKVENLHRNPHRKSVWIDALRKVHEWQETTEEKPQQLDEHKGTKPHKHPHDDEEGLEERYKVGRTTYKNRQEYEKAIDAVKEPDMKDLHPLVRKQLKKKVKKEEVEIDEKASDYEDQIKAYLAKGGKIQKGDKPNKRKIDMVTKGFMKKFGTMKKKEADLDAKDKEELEKMMGEAVIQETWLDNDAKKVQSKWKKMDKKAKKKWMDGIMAKAKKEGMPKDELMDVLDDYGLTMEETSNLNKLEDWGIDLRKEGYMVMPAIDREKYTPMRGLEGPFPTFSGKVLYYDPKAGMYYDRDSDIYLSYDAYLEYDKISPSQQKQMKLGPLGDPKSKEYKSMERIKKKVAKLAKRDQLKNESVGLRLARKFYQKEKDNGGS